MFVQGGEEFVERPVSPDDRDDIGPALLDLGPELDMRILRIDAAKLLDLMAMAAQSAGRLPGDVLTLAFARRRVHDHGNLHGITLESYPAAAFAARRSVKRAISSETR
jgi:hypothetical protein